MKACKHCGKDFLALLRGRTRKFCSDRCRLASHKRGKTTRLRPAGNAGTVAAEPGGMAVWAAWVRGAYAVDRTGDELLRMTVEADHRYVQARDALNVHGLTQVGADGRATARPEVAIERDTRAAIARLIQQLGLESDEDEDQKTPRGTAGRFPRAVGR